MKKINIAELLKDCPQGMELDCAMWDDVVFESIEPGNYPIKIRIKGDEDITTDFTEFGEWNYLKNSKCVIFPKGKTTWEGFVPPCKFNDGDILSNGICICIYDGNDNDEHYGCYVAVGQIDFPNYFLNHPQDKYFTKENAHLATEEEKQKLFDAIKDNGYRWNAEKKTLEELIKPIFKKGDKVRVKNGLSEYRVIIDNVEDTFYSLVPIGKIDFTDQNRWELVPNKFDINSLVPFESRVLVRNVDGDLWKPAIYGFPHSKGCYVVGGVYWGQCIPYEKNKELLGTTNNPEEYGSR